jgi:hypothetical protein
VTLRRRANTNRWADAASQQHICLLQTSAGCRALSLHFVSNGTGSAPNPVTSAKGALLLANRVPVSCYLNMVLTCCCVCPILCPAVLERESNTLARGGFQVLGSAQGSSMAAAAAAADLVQIAGLTYVVEHLDQQQRPLQQRCTLHWHAERPGLWGVTPGL